MSKASTSGLGYALFEDERVRSALGRYQRPGVESRPVDKLVESESHPILTKGA